MKSLIPNIQVMEAGAAPLIAAMCDEIKLADTINQLVIWDDKNSYIQRYSNKSPIASGSLVSQKGSGAILCMTVTCYPN